MNAPGKDNTEGVRAVGMAPGEMPPLQRSRIKGVGLGLGRACPEHGMRRKRRAPLAQLARRRAELYRALAFLGGDPQEAAQLKALARPGESPDGLGHELKYSIIQEIKAGEQAGSKPGNQTNQP
jgi:hypothetical protein